MTPNDLAECALAAGATQLGEAGTVHYLFNLDQLARLLDIVTAGAPALPPPLRPPPY